MFRLKCLVSLVRQGGSVQLMGCVALFIADPEPMFKVVTAAKLVCCAVCRVCGICGETGECISSR